MQLGTASGTSAEKVYVVVQENGAEEILAGEVCEWVATTTSANQGLMVQVIDSALNLTSGIGAKVAGVAETTISTSSIGRLQVYGPGNVRASASIALGRSVVASSINATNIGYVEAASQSTAVGVEYLQAYVGVTLVNGPNATNATVQIDVL